MSFQSRSRFGGGGGGGGVGAAAGWSNPDAMAWSNTPRSGFGSGPHSGSGPGGSSSLLKSVGSATSLDQLFAIGSGPGSAPRTATSLDQLFAAGSPAHISMLARYAEPDPTSPNAPFPPAPFDPSCGGEFGAATDLVFDYGDGSTGSYESANAHVNPVVNAPLPVGTFPSPSSAAAAAAAELHRLDGRFRRPPPHPHPSAAAAGARSRFNSYDSTSGEGLHSSRDRTMVDAEDTFHLLGLHTSLALPLPFPAMNRGASNMEAALDEVQASAYSVLDEAKVKMQGGAADDPALKRSPTAGLAPPPSGQEGFTALGAIPPMPQQQQQPHPHLYNSSSRDLSQSQASDYGELSQSQSQSQSPALGGGGGAGGGAAFDTYSEYTSDDDFYGNTSQGRNSNRLEWDGNVKFPWNIAAQNGFQGAGAATGNGAPAVAGPAGPNGTSTLLRSVCESGGVEAEPSSSSGAEAATQRGDEEVASPGAHPSCGRSSTASSSAVSTAGSGRVATTQGDQAPSGALHAPLNLLPPPGCIAALAGLMPGLPPHPHLGADASAPLPALQELQHFFLLHAKIQTGGGLGHGVMAVPPLAAAPHHAAAAGSVAMALSPLDPPPPRLGAHTREERARRLARYKEKRARRCWAKRVLYQVRKDFAAGRRRVGGRFVKKDQEAALLAQASSCSAAVAALEPEQLCLSLDDFSPPSSVPPSQDQD